MGLLVLIALLQLVVSVLILNALQDLRGPADPLSRIDQMHGSTMREMFAAEAMARRQHSSDIIESTAQDMRR